jgi:hypothetical protein
LYSSFKKSQVRGSTDIKNVKKTKEYVTALKAEKPNIKNFIIAKPGGVETNGGTWVNQRLPPF